MISYHKEDIDFASSLNNGGFVDLNAITVLNPVYKPVNVMNNNGIFSTNPITNFRSKLRSTASSSHRSVDTGPSLSIFSALPPSPAELLRKYSASNGYTCEMDKLFKGRQHLTFTHEKIRFKSNICFKLRQKRLFCHSHTVS